MDPAERLRRYAELAVRVGANVQPGQLVGVTGIVENAPLMRAVAGAAYQAGAHLVAPVYFDRHITRALIESGPDDSLGASPPGYLELLQALDAKKGAFIQVRGEADPTLFADLDGNRVGKARPKQALSEWLRIIGDRTVNWTLIGAPNAGWAQQVFGKPDVEALWQAVVKAVRLDRDDPIAAWRDHVRRLRTIADALDERHFDALRYRGPGTDFTVGLLPSSRWLTADQTTVSGVHHIVNLPTEEVFTTPDRHRADGTLRSTRPLQILGTVVRDLEVELRDGRIIGVKATAGADVVRAEIAADDGADRLGEISLVDGASMVGQLGLTFCDTLFDENATSHIAYGGAYAEAVGDEDDRAAGMNVSSVHTDFMVGGPEVDIDGRERSGAWVQIMRNNEFQIG